MDDIQWYTPYIFWIFKNSAYSLFLKSIVSVYSLGIPSSYSVYALVFYDNSTIKRYIRHICPWTIIGHIICCYIAVDWWLILERRYNKGLPKSPLINIFFLGKNMESRANKSQVLKKHSNTHTPIRKMYWKTMTF